MLPKVATHILHTTSRAAAGAVHNPLRNVFQSSSSTGSNLGTWNGPGNSNWGGHGPGTGSTKQNTGSRYYSSFNTAGRAVSQANAVSANVDGTFAQSDENDEFVPRRVTIQNLPQSQTKRPRFRSSSVSLTKAESLGVLKTVQFHARSRFLHSAPETSHSPAPPAFKSASPLTPSRPRRNSVSSSGGLVGPPSPVRQISTATTSDPGSQRVDDLTVRPRRNSTSSADGLDRVSLEAPNPVPEELLTRPRRNSTSSIDEIDYSDISSVETKPTTPPQSPQPSISSTSAPPSPRFPALAEAKESRDPHRVAEAVAHFRATAKDPRTDDFNLALEALYVTRHGESVIPMLELYNDMLKRSTQPNHQTYNLLMLALTDRDSELEYTLRVLMALKRRNDLFALLEEDMEGKQKNLQNRADILRSEQQDNFASIMTLFHAANSANWADIPHSLYFQLLRACSFNSNVNAALQIFRHIEKSYSKIGMPYYRLLIQAYGKTGDIKGVEKVFEHYMATAKAGRIFMDAEPDRTRKTIVKNYNAMIEAYFQCGLPDKAIGILDQMMNSEAGLDFGPTDVPHPNSATFTAVLAGFCESGDPQTAWAWYERLSQQGIVPQDLHEPSEHPTKPDAVAAGYMIEALAKHGMIVEMTKVYMDFRPSIQGGSVMPLVVFGATMEKIQNLDDESVRQTMQFLRREVMTNITKPYYRQMAAYQLETEYLRRGMLDEALGSYLEFFDRLMQEIRTANPETKTAAANMSVLQFTFNRFLSAYIDAAVREGALTFRMSLTLMQVGQILGAELPKKVRKRVLHSYALARAQGQLPLADLTLKDWEKLLGIAVQVEMATLSDAADWEVEGYAFGGVLSLLEDFATYNIEFNNLAPAVISKTIRHLISVCGPNHLIGVFQNLGPVFQHALEESEEIRMLAVEGKLHAPPQNVLRNERTQMLLGSYGNLVVTSAQTKYVEEVLKHNNVRSEVLDAYGRLQQGLKERKVPGPWVLGRLIQGLGRQGDVEKVKEVYTIAQAALKGMELRQEAWRDGWRSVEDSMTIALAHAGDVDSAHVHRTRILEQGAAPSADAYGALILHVKDTTDDASNAMMLYREAQLAGIEMNIYLYNNIISKLAKARKADHALELFHRMKAQGIKPTSITYGALIGACARVGDVQSAETLFGEMVEQKNFKPRVPPYNTMMQLYTMTKPNRERALYFYEQLGKAGVRPTAHTYKLLLDAYGSIEPVDIASMEAVLEQLKEDPTVAIQGTHYASLINAYGCVQRDLHKAIAVFDSIPSSQTPPALDAVVFESVINVLVSHRRTDLIPEYIAKMNAEGVHMTAYIANFLIKGYSIVGDLEGARSLFESLVDPPTGVAAPNNHAPHDLNTSVPVGCTEPVYREPSTWEAMVRAELGAGYRDRALDLLQRLKARQYPEAVYNRISGVLVDHSAVAA